MSVLTKWVAGLLCLFFLAGCGSSDSTSNSEQESQPIDVIDSASVDEPAPESVSIEEDAVSGGITVSVASIKESPSVVYEGGTQSEETPDGNRRQVDAEPGATFLMVDTEVTNESKGPIDLTCGWPIDASVINSDEQRFTPIDGLSQIKGNPECNDQLQPGFRDEMQWIFLVPEDDEIVEFEFADVSDFEVSQAPAVVRLAD